MPKSYGCEWQCAASAREAASVRMRPILMTSVAMVVGMIPMASGLGEGGSQAAPLGRAVIGGLIASTFAALFILPLAFAWVQGNTSTQSVSLILKIKTVNITFPPRMKRLIINNPVRSCYVCW